MRRLPLPGGPGWVLSLSVAVDPDPPRPVGQPEDPPALQLLDGSGATLQRLEAAPEHLQHVVWPLAGEDLLLEVAAHGVLVTDAVVYGPNVLDEGVAVVALDADPPQLLDGAALSRRYATDPWRPAYHFSARSGWLNDPNGLVTDGDRVHLFFQANPHGPDWGNMHWGHAVSEDLVHWRHLPSALYPQDELVGDPSVFGGAFSGSALVVDGRVRLFYTRHLEARDGSRFQETQEWAELADGVHADPRGTLVGAPPGPSYGPDFRDPKVWREDDGSFAMVLGSRHHGLPCVLLYRSPDARNWTFDTVLHREEQFGAGTVECPDFFLLDGTHVLVAGLLGSEDPGIPRKHQSYAWLGRYDGSSFTVRSRHDLDAGPDLYAMQTFLRGGRRYAMAWMDSWGGAYPTKGSGWAGAMALPRELRVRDGRLHQQPVQELERLRLAPLLDVTGAPSGPVPLPGSALEIQLHLSGRGVLLRLGNNAGEEVTVGFDGRGDLVVTSRCHRDRPGHARASWPRLHSVRIFADRSSIEVFADEGALTLTTSVYPSQQWSALQVSAAPGADVERLRVWQLRAAHPDAPTRSGGP